MYLVNTMHFKIYLYGNEKLNLDYKHGLTDEIFMWYWWMTDFLKWQKVTSHLINLEKIQNMLGMHPTGIIILVDFACHLQDVSRHSAVLKSEKCNLAEAALFASKAKA